MKLYLTSSPTGTYLKWDVKEFDGLNPQNGMVEELKKDLDTADVRCMMIAAFPESYEQNDQMKADFRERLTETGFTVSRMSLCDRRNASEMMEELHDHNMIILGGGHVPTENAFFAEIGLKEKLNAYNGVVMGISAGTMNCAGTVYAQPEEPGESVDPSYERFLPGLGLTEINVLPHYNAVKDFMLDGKRLFEDITYPDSFGHTFYAVTDGSYILQRDKEVSFRGEIYRISEGRITPV